MKSVLIRGKKISSQEPTFTIKKHQRVHENIDKSYLSFNFIFNNKKTQPTDFQ